ncbi:hypothetical protein LTR04_005103 [Oleoguttula sp. CCFEE 6159]|nr:hypothetical protein LTR04_005103 [Oleoguttula sp. CCFEE 6159]
MLSPRLFRQLTASLLLDRPLVLTCRCSPRSTISQWPASPRNLRHVLAPPRNLLQARPASSSSSSTRWKSRQTRDVFSREAKVQGLKSRAAFKLLELNEKHKLFKPGQTVIDLGYAPGSWSQVAVRLTAPHGRVVGIDVIPAQPPRGASTIQGNFLSEAVQTEVRQYVQDPQRGRPRKKAVFASQDAEEAEEEGRAGVTELELDELGRAYIDIERGEGAEGKVKMTKSHDASASEGGRITRREMDELEGRVVDVVLSDMSAPWEQTSGLWIRSVSDPYFRMMNTSGMAFRDHAGSMDLCTAALTFCYDTLRTGGHFLCKFYQGAEDKAFETKLKRLFEKVHREKPESSRSESKEAYFVALRRKPDLAKEDVFR